MARRRSESEIRWVRSRRVAPAKTITGTLETVSKWHVVIPDWPTPRPPGVACATGLDGTLQWDTTAGKNSREGETCKACAGLHQRWLEEILIPSR